ncbi:hypothetical protein HB848_05985 [Listeria rocourtiae]|uniref:hypothetical protein n=1 Tax=Listeria rocourtiae TaxID=647910 RepID=UPI00162AA306|nr:hypothetical protein [Listeria rocourtiae]MBC1434883.1 hypothetical protein [Listeria rocourtiae]
MNSQQRLEDDYLRDKRRLEEKDEMLFHQKRKGMQALDTIAEASHYYLRDFAPDTMHIRRGMDGLEEMRAEVESLHRKEQRRLDDELEDLTSNYRRQQSMRSEKEESL